jgi:tRNA pseudouridine13 synthase
MGIEVYATKTAGVGGAIKRAVEDFVVEEVLVDGSKATAAAKADAKPPLGASAARQRYLMCMLIKRNWDTFIAIRNVANALGVDQGKIQIAGIKDAKAVTAQYITIEGVTAEAAAAVDIKDVELRPIGYFRDALCPFYLLGNRFKIKITQISQPATAVAEQTAKTAAEIASAGGIPNFYGHQRFGTTRAITHLVGRAMAMGNLEQAAMKFLANPSPFEHPDSRHVRSDLQATQNFQKALREFPIQLRFERLMLRHLAENQSDFVGAFRRLPLKLRMLFVQAWQSYLFNRFLSARISAGYSLQQAQEGDIIVNVERSGLPMTRTAKTVQAANTTETNKLIAEGKMRIALPILGARQKLSGGAMGELERQVLEAEGVADGGFFVSELPEINSKGDLRAVVCPVADYSMGEASADSSGQLCLPLEFRLLKGAYATVLLRELMKPQNLITAGF